MGYLTVRWAHPHPAPVEGEGVKRLLHNVVNHVRLYWADTWHAISGRRTLVPGGATG